MPRREEYEPTRLQEGALEELENSIDSITKDNDLSKKFVERMSMYLLHYEAYHTNPNSQEHQIEAGSQLKVLRAELLKASHAIQKLEKIPYSLLNLDEDFDWSFLEDLDATISSTLPRIEASISQIPHHRSRDPLLLDLIRSTAKCSKKVLGIRVSPHKHSKFNQVLGYILVALGIERGTDREVMIKAALRPEDFE